jgi:hypothetical protein
MGDWGCEFYQFVGEHQIVLVFAKKVLKAIGMVEQVNDGSRLHFFIARCEVGKGV